MVTFAYPNCHHPSFDSWVKAGLFIHCLRCLLRSLPQSVRVMLTCQFTGQMYDIKTQFVKKEIVLHVSSGTEVEKLSTALQQ